MADPTRASSAGLHRRTFLIAAATAIAGTGVPGGSTAMARGGRHGKEKWVASWTGSAHGTYPLGTAIAQPDLNFAFPSPATGARDQTFRLIVRPTLWSDEFRLRFSNAFGTQPVTLDDVYLGLQASAGTVAAGTNRRVTFGRQRAVTLPPGEVRYSDRVALEDIQDRDRFGVEGRKLAVSFHVVGTSGPMTWHSKALQTSYITAPGAGSHGKEESDEAFPFSTTSWYFLDAVEALAPANTVVVAALGDSITDGTGSTLNGDDRWPDVLFRRLRDAYGHRVAVVNAGIGGNRILSAGGAGGPAALDRLERDVFSLAGISAVVWLEGINDLGGAGASAEAIIAGIEEGVLRMRARNLTVIQATITSSLNSTIASYSTPELNARRQAINTFIRTAGIFDGVADFDAVTVDPSTGELRPEFLPNSTTGVVDRLHPNRAGYVAMGRAVDIGILAPSKPEPPDEDDD
jgi:lysophospholipase L1-like esterase